MRILFLYFMLLISCKTGINVLTIFFRETDYFMNYASYPFNWINDATKYKTLAKLLLVISQIVLLHDLNKLKRNYKVNISLEN